MLPKYVRLLTYAAALGWLISLFLPGFRLHDGTAPLGWGILAMLPLAWLGGGWAAYANPFFLYVAFKSLRGKPAPIAVVLMLLLALSTLSVDEMLINEAGHTSTVVSWGWGAMLWGLSLATIAVASMSLSSNLHTGRGIALTVFATICVLLLAVGGIRFQQWHQANEQDRKAFLSPSMAFTTAELCDEPFIWPEKSPIPAGERISVEVDERLKGKSRPWLSLPQLPGIQQEDGMAWITFDDNPFPISTVKVQVPISNARYFLRVNKTDSGAIIQMLDTLSGVSLYEQPLAIRRNKNGYATYCPTAWERSIGGMGYQKAILRLVQREPRPSSSPALLSQAIFERCPPETGVRIGDWVTWDGREIVLPGRLYGLDTGLCSKSYAAIVEVGLQMERADSQPEVWSAQVWLFDRPSLRPITGFSYQQAESRGAVYGQRAMHRYYKAPAEMIQGLVIENSDTVRVQTELGEIVLSRWPQNNQTDRH